MMHDERASVVRFEFKAGGEPSGAALIPMSELVWWIAFGDFLFSHVTAIVHLHRFRVMRAEAWFPFGFQCD